MSLSLRQALQRIETLLKDVRNETPRRLARLIVCEVLELSPESLLARLDEAIVTQDHVEALERFALRCANDEPFSRVAGWREFYGRRFALSSETLDPRPDTETLIELCLEIVAEKELKEQPLRLLDVGTGSGAIIVTLLSELPNATGVATDVSEDALRTAQRNAEIHGVCDRLQLQLASGLAEVGGQFDLVVSNPPYIASSDIAGLDRNVRAYDPLRALDGGVDGLDVFRLIINDLHNIVDRGWVLFEVGAGQAPHVAQLLEQSVFGKGRGRIWTKADLSGHERCVAIATVSSS